MDSHADTSCAGCNFRMIIPSGFTCDVYPFHGKTAANRDIPIGTCATVLTTVEGKDILLVGHEMLYFGADLPRSLLNPNQLRHHGICVQDDYTREDEQFGIHLPGVFIPFTMAGTTIFFETRSPTDHDLDTLQQVEFTSDIPWHPDRVQLRVSSTEIPGPIAFQSQIYETETVLSQISTVYSEHSTDQRIIASMKTDQHRDVGAMMSAHRHSKASPEQLSRIWKIGLETAQKTMRVTTQQGIRTAIHPITRRYRVDHLNLHRNRFNTTFYLDELFAKTTSLRGNKCATVFTDGQFTAVYPLTSKANAGATLDDFAQDDGVPEYLTTDLAGELSGKHTEFMRHARAFRIQMHWVEKGHHKQNHKAEREIGILKQRWRRRMIDRSIPMRLWDYGLVYEAEILSRMSRGKDGRTGLERLTGQTPDISEWLDFSFYDLVWFHSVEKPALEDDSRRLGRWLGISHRVGSDLCYWILTDSGQVLSCSTVQHVIREDALNPEIKSKIELFDAKVKDRLDDTGFVSDDVGSTSPYIEDIELENPYQARTGVVPSDEEYGDMIVEEKPDADEHEDLDQYIGAQLMLDVGGEQLQARVVKRARGPDGAKIGRAHTNPLFDNRAYLLEFPDGSIQEYTANVIAENMYAQIDSEGRSFAIMKEISDHRADDTAVAKEDGYVFSRNGNRRPKTTTRGWSLLVEWKGGQTEWVPLKDLKDSNPIEVAEYAVANKIDDEPAFKWWVPNTLRIRRRIISKTQKKYWRTSHKFGIQLPHSVQEALAIDKATGTDFWYKAIRKELAKVKVAWEARDGLDKGECRAGRQLIGYTEIRCHMIFDVKMDFTRKARFVAGGHLTEAPPGVTYSSVVSRDSIRLAFLVAALNDLNVMACDIGNAYLNAPAREKCWFIGGDDVGEDKGKVLVIVRALYGLKSSGASWRLTLSQTLMDMGFVSTRADPDVYRRNNSRTDGSEYYELLLVYVDDILLVSHEPKATIDRIGEQYEIKEGSAGEPTSYLGAQVYRHTLPDGRWAWGMSSEKYVKNAVKTVQDLLRGDGEGYHLKTTANVPFPTSYKPELDFSAELKTDLISRYRQLIGILRWAVELGRVDVYLETSLLSHYLASPREGHLEAAYHIFAYLKTHTKTSLVFDPKDISLDESAFSPATVQEWREFYGEVVEELPPGMPEPRGRAVDITCFVDADHAGNVVTRRSQTGILIFVQNAPIIWFSKKQNTVESSSFGSEFVAMRIARDMLVALRYKLRMFGVPITGPASILCDNQGVVKNTSLPASTLTKRHNAINFHAVREAAAAGILRVGKEDGDTNLADVFTKVLARPRRYDLFSRIIYSSMFGRTGPPTRAGVKRPHFVS